MDRFKKILYLGGHPPSNRSFSCALELARVNEAVLTVVSDASRAAGGGGPGLLSGSDHLREQLARSRERALAALAERGAAEGVEVRTGLLWKPPFPALVHEVLRSGHDLVIKVAEDDGGIRARLFGGTDHDLLRTCPCPVWILDPAQRGRFRVVLAAVDVARERPAGLNRKIVQLASSLALREDATLYVVHALSMIGESILRSGMRGLGSARVERILDRVRDERLRLVEDLLASEAPEPEARIIVEKGKPARVIRSVVRRTEADVLVIGTVARTGMEALFMGNAAEEVLGRVHCSVLAVKPDGFTTPVELPDGAGGTEESRGRPRRRRAVRPTPEERS